MKPYALLRTILQGMVGKPAGLEMDQFVPWTYTAASHVNPVVIATPLMSVCWSGGQKSIQPRRF